MYFLKNIPHKWLLFGPTLLFALGFLLNQFAISANKGSMPVLWPGGCQAMQDEQQTESDAGQDDAIHVCMTPKTHLKILSDWVDINGFGIVSPGDFLIMQFDYTFWPALSIWVFIMIYERRHV